MSILVEFNCRKINSASMVNTLTQAIQSGDKGQLDEVLKHGSFRVIKATIEKLPIELIVPFLDILVDKLRDFPKRGSELISWISYIIHSRTSYLCSQNFLEDSNKNPLNRLKQFLDSRTVLFNAVSKLHGRINVALHNAGNEVDEYAITTSKPIIVEEPPEIPDSTYETELLVDNAEQLVNGCADAPIVITKTHKRSKSNGIVKNKIKKTSADDN